MFTNVVIIGLVGRKAADNARFLEVERSYKDHEGKFKKDFIPVVYWTRTANNFFMNLKEGTYVAIHGRLEHLDALGIGVVCDALEYMGNKAMDTIEAPRKVV